MLSPFRSAALSLAALSFAAAPARADSPTTVENTSRTGTGPTDAGYQANAYTVPTGPSTFVYGSYVFLNDTFTGYSPAAGPSDPSVGLFLNATNASALIGSGTYTGGTPAATSATAGADGLMATVTSLTLTGGTYAGTGTGSAVEADSGATAIYGGTFTAGPSGYGLSGAFNTFTLYGYDLSETITSSGFDVLQGYVTGTLANNSAPSTITFNLGHAGSLAVVNVAAVPEPSPLALLAFGVPVLGLLARGRRSRA